MFVFKFMRTLNGNSKCLFNSMQLKYDKFISDKLTCEIDKQRCKATICLFSTEFNQKI